MLCLGQEGDSALTMAAAGKKKDVVKYLLDRGAERSHRNKVLICTSSCTSMVCELAAESL